MSESPNRVVALGSPTGEHRAAIEAACRRASAELLITRDPPKALAELRNYPTLAVLVDMAVLGAENFCRKARTSEQLRRVPIIGLSRNPGELSFNRVFAWGADDLVPLGQEHPLAERLVTLAETATVTDESFGQAVVADSNAERCTLIGRVLTQAGYSVKYAIDAASAEYYASQSETRLCVLNASLTIPRRLIEAVEQSGALPMWVVLTEQRLLPTVVKSLSGIERVAVTSTAGSPEDVLFVANELVFSRGNKRREWRALYGTPVLFRSAGSNADEFGFTYDISPSGIYVRSLLPCEFTEVELELRPPRRENVVRLRGQIVRRFRFGSGAIASAPPGFGVKLADSDDEATNTWRKACEEFLRPPTLSPTAPEVVLKPSASPAAKEPPPTAPSRPSIPRATTSSTSAAGPSSPRLRPAARAAQAPRNEDTRPENNDLAGREPLPSDVGSMLAEALDHQALPSAGARPVAMSFDRDDVFERVSAVPPEAARARSNEAEPVPASPKPAGPAAPTEPGASTPNTLHGPPRVTPPPVSAGGPPPPVSAGGPPPPPSRAKLASAAALPSAKRTLLMGSPAPVASAPGRPASSQTPPVPSPPPPRAVALAPPLHSSAPSSTALSNQPAEPPASATPAGAAAPAARLSSTVVMNPLAHAPTPVAAMPAVSLKEAAPPADELFPPATGNNEPTFVSAQSPPPVTKPVDVTVAVPAKTTSLTPEPSRDAVTAKRSAAPKPNASLPATSARIAAGQAPAAEPARSRTPLLLVGLLCVGSLAGAGAFIARSKQGAVARAAAPTSELSLAAPSATSALPSRVASSPASVAEGAALDASAPTPEGSAEAAPPSAPSSAPAPLASAAPSVADEPSAATSAPATDPSPAPAPSASATPSPAPETAPLPEVDLSQLGPKQGYLYVRSSADARVFVLANDVGPTNTPLIVNCGTKFVRLGRTLGDFIEPGGSIIIKCGALTELRREPR